MKFLNLLTLFVIFSGAALAIESVSQMGGMNSLLEVRTQIENVKARLTTMETTINDAAACGDAGQHYTGTACIVVNEVDPALKIQGTKSMVAACAGTNTAQYYNIATNTWACKTLKN